MAKGRERSRNCAIRFGVAQIACNPTQKFEEDYRKIPPKKEK